MQLALLKRLLDAGNSDMGQDSPGDLNPEPLPMPMRIGIEIDGVVQAAYGPKMSSEGKAALVAAMPARDYIELSNRESGRTVTAVKPANFQGREEVWKHQ